MWRDLQGHVEARGPSHLIGEKVGLPHEAVGPDDVLPKLGQAALKGLVSEI